MRTHVPGLVFAALLVAGCCTRRPPEVIGPAWDSPEKAFRTLRALVIGRRPDLLYLSFSPMFKKEYGVPDSRAFGVGYRTLAEKGDLDDLETALENAESTDVQLGTDPETGLRWARVRVTAETFLYAMEWSFIFVEIPTARIGTRIPGYGPTTEDYFVPGPGFGGHLRVDDGIVRAAFDASASGVAETGEVTEFRLHHQWLLRDIQDLPVDVRAIMDELRRSAGGTQ